MHFFRFLRDAPYFARWAQYGLLAPYWLCQYGLLKPYFAHAQYGLLAVLCAHARCAHTHGFWRPIGFANTGFCIFAILRDFCVSVATRASGMS